MRDQPLLPRIADMTVPQLEARAKFHLSTARHLWRCGEQTEASKFLQLSEKYAAEAKRRIDEGIEEIEAAEESPRSGRMADAQPNYGSKPF